MTLAEIKAVAQHPAPNIDKLIAQINTALQAVGNGLRDAVRAEISQIVDELADALIFVVTFKQEIDENGQPGQITMTVGETTTTVADNDVEAEPLYQFLVVALTGRPDTWTVVKKEDGTVDHLEQTLSFDIRNYASLNAQGAQQAAAITADQLLHEALLYDSVSKPLIDGYILVNQLAATFSGNVADFEKQLHELPKQLTLVLCSWITGALGLERVFGLSQAFTGHVEDRLREALQTYVDPLVALPDARPEAAAIDVHMAAVLDKIDAIATEATGAPDAKTAIGQARIKLAKLRLRVAAAFDDYESLREQLTKPSDLVPSSSSPDFDRVRTKIAGGLGKLFAAQKVLLASLNDTIAASADAMDAIATAALADGVRQAMAKLVADVEQATVELIDKLFASIPAFPSMPSGLEPVFATFDAVMEITNAATSVVKDAQDLRTAVGNAKVTLSSQPSVDEMKAFAENGRTFLKDAGRFVSLLGVDQRALSGLATRGLMLGENVLQQIDKQAFAKVQPAIVNALALLSSPGNPPGLYEIAEMARVVMDPAKWLDPDTKAVLELFLNKKMLDALSQLSDTNSVAIQLKEERKQIEAVQTSVAAAADFKNLDHAAVNALIKTVHTWSAEAPPGPARVLAPIQQIADLLLKGKLADLVDLHGLEVALENALLSFIPAQVSFDYDWGVPLKPFPSESSKLFWIDQEAKALGPSKPFDISAPFRDKVRKPASDLTIYVRAGVDLRVPAKPKPILQAEADIRFCDINLFGASFDVVTIKFEQIRFTLDETGSDFHARLAAEDPVTFGPVVGYIAELASVFGGDSGIYIHPAFSPLGIIIGYRYAQDIISLGTLSLVNFAVDVSVQLSFDNTPVSFRLALAERDKPLIIICTPYGGGGYVALRTVASDIVGFEMQFEFGGATAIKFGPLHASGFVSAGIYIEKQKGQALILEGFVRAIGEGTIVCFSISVFFEVRIHQQGSDVTGQLTVSVSFKVGFVKLTYSYTALYKFSGKSGGNTSLLARGENIHIEVANRQDDWKKYRSYFAALSR